MGTTGGYVIRSHNNQCPERFRRQHESQNWPLSDNYEGFHEVNQELVELNSWHGSVRAENGESARECWKLFFAYSQPAMGIF